MKTKLIDLSTLRVNHVLAHHNNDTWSVRAILVPSTNDEPFLFSFDVNTGEHKTAQAALRAHHQLLKKTYPGWFVK